MLPRQTLFVIGAGAGIDLGMPLGDALSMAIGNKTDIRFDAAEQISGDRKIMSVLRGIAQEKNEDVNLLRAAGCLIKGGIRFSRSIDTFLNTHKDNNELQTCAKLALVQTILEHENASILYVGSDAAESDFRSPDLVQRSWLADFMYILQEGIVTSENIRSVFKNLTIINFNYDRCIEHFLFNALQTTFLIPPELANELMGTLKIYHPYGQVGHLWPKPGQRSVPFGRTNNKDLVGLSSEIRTFNETVEENDELKAMREEVSIAEQIIFLGFHFHPQNVTLLQSLPPPRDKVVYAYATALKRSEPDKKLLYAVIAQMLAYRGGANGDVCVENICDCKRLFEQYQATWMRR